MGPGGAIGSVGASGQWPQWPKPRGAKRRNRLADVTVSVALPWLVFFLILSLFLFAYHDMRLVVWVLVGLCVCLAGLFMTLGFCGRHSAFVAIGLMCLLSVSLATAVGSWLHSQYLVRYWELEKGSVYKDVDPSADPDLTTDAGIITFGANAFVDDSRTLGFLADGGIFCVAPVAVPPYYSDKVNYWAVGTGCCQTRSAFDCGPSRELGTLSGMPELTEPRYSQAVAEAVAVYGLTNSPGAQLLSFAENPQQVITEMWDETLTLALLAMLADLVICCLAGVGMARLLQPQSRDSEKTPLRK